MANLQWSRATLSRSRICAITIRSHSSRSLQRVACSVHTVTVGCAREADSRREATHVIKNYLADIHQLCRDHFNTLGAWRDHFLDETLGDSLKGHVRCEETHTNTKNVLDRESDLATNSSLIKLHFVNFKRKALVEHTGDLRTSAQGLNINQVPTTLCQTPLA